MQARIDQLRLGSQTIPPMWDAPIPPSIEARLLANDTDAFIALTEGLVKSPALDDVLSTMRMPCLLFVGENDGSFPRVRECSAEMPNAKLVTFLGFNHAGTFFQSGAVIAEVRTFLKAAVLAGKRLA
jgi:pimeloyl-ACP methyl ester carboxylesterase